MIEIASTVSLNNEAVSPFFPPPNNKTSPRSTNFLENGLIRSKSSSVGPLCDRNSPIRDYSHA